MRIYPVVNINKVVQYKEQVEVQKVGEVKLVEVDGVEKWEVEKILNKRKIREVVKYLVHWKRFIVKSNTWKKKKDLENTIEKRLSAKDDKRSQIELRKRTLEEGNYQENIQQKSYIDRIIRSLRRST